jgi:hypothetical protein
MALGVSGGALRRIQRELMEVAECLASQPVDASRITLEPETENNLCRCFIP